MSAQAGTYEKGIYSVFATFDYFNEADRVPLTGPVEGADSDASPSRLTVKKDLVSDQKSGLKGWRKC